MTKLGTTLSLALGLLGSAHAATVTITTVDIRQGGVYGHDANIGGAPGVGQPNVFINGAAVTNAIIGTNPLTVQFTYSNLDLDGDSTPNDSLTFTLTATNSLPGPVTGTPRTMNQGIDHGFGSLDGLTLTGSVTGTTTDLGLPIVFDGFSGLSVAKGSSNANLGSVDVNGGSGAGGTSYSLSTPGGGFNFVQDIQDFNPVASLVFSGNSSDGGTMVARNYDLQFSTIPEPSRAILLGFGLFAVLVGNRRR